MTTRNAEQRDLAYGVPAGYQRSRSSRASTHRRAFRPATPEPVRGDGLQALTRDVLVSRSLHVSSMGFGTIVSIIQGVALALLAQNTFAKPSPLVYAQSLTLLMIFVIVFYFYVTMGIFLRWAPSFLDFFLPFGIAGLEIPPAFYLGSAAEFHGWLAAFWLFTAAGLYITIRWSPPSDFGQDRKAHRMLHRLLHELQLTAALGGILAGTLGILAAFHPQHRTWWVTLGVITMLSTVAMVVARTELRASQIYARFGVHRPPFN